MAHIYKITNKINGKVYIGKTELSNPKERFLIHLSDADKDRNKDRPLYRAMNKYGKDNFEFEIIEETNNPNEREIALIEEYDSYNSGYNATLGGDGRSYIDYSSVIELYEKTQSITEVSNILGISVDSVSNYLKNNEIEILPSTEVNKNKYSKNVLMLDKSTLNIIKEFNSLHEAAAFMVDNKLTNCKNSTIQTHISENCRGKRKSAGGYRWSFK